MFEFVDESHYLTLTKSGSNLSVCYVKDEFVITSKKFIFACLLVYGMTMSYGYWHNTESNYLRNCLNYHHLIIFFPISHQKLNLEKIIVNYLYKYNFTLNMMSTIDIYCWHLWVLRFLFVEIDVNNRHLCQQSTSIVKDKIVFVQVF